MKKIKFISAILVYITINGCDPIKNDPQKDCEGKKPNCDVIDMSYAPVCGCDDKDYNNPAHAKCNGINMYTAGKCSQEAYIRYFGEISVDGCGYKIEVNDSLYNNDSIPAEFLINDLKVLIKYKLMPDSSSCGLMPAKYRNIHLYSISKL